MRGQVGGWLYIVCGRTGGLGSDDTRAGRAGWAGSGGVGRGIGLAGNGVGLERGTGSD